MSFLHYTAVLAAAATTAYAHGTVSGVVADGVYNQGYNPSMQYSNPPPVVVGWSIPQDLGNGFVSDPTSQDAICHLGATPAGKSATVKAGGTVDWQWTAWPASHKGPMMTYLADCGGDCTKVDKASLKWFKIDAVGLVDPKGASNGLWGSDQMIANNNTWRSTIPASLKAGNYVGRHETIALHAAGSVGGAQMYPFCVNLQVTGGGSTVPDGVVGTSLYTAQSLVFNLYTTLTSYTIPGPAIPAAFAGSGSGAGGGAPSVAPAASSAVASAASSAVAVVPSSAVVVVPSAAATSDVKPAAVTVTSMVNQYTTVYAPAPTVTVAAVGSTGGAKALPAGTTIDDLLAWLKIVLNQQSMKKRGGTLSVKDVLGMVF